MAKGGDKAEAKQASQAADAQFQQAYQGYKVSPYIEARQQKANDWLNQADSGADVSTLPGIAGRLAKLSMSDMQAQRVPYLGGAAQAENSFLQPIADKQFKAQAGQERGAMISDIMTQEYGTKLNELFNTSGMMNQVEAGRMGAAEQYSNQKQDMYKNLLNQKPFWQQMLLGGMQAGASLGSAAITACAIASELYGGWYEVPTINIRKWMQFKAPKWLLYTYIKVGPTIAGFLRRNPLFKEIFFPVFNYLARQGAKLD